MDSAARVASLDAALPQTQCTRCGYPSCRDYAEAMARDAAPINQCPPGGTETMLALASLTGRPIAPLNPDNGIESAPKVAFIDEDRCIGCTKCLPPCPVDAIVGARQRMHTVVAELCTGCELCVAPCPVDCIVMIPLLASPLSSLTLPAAEDSRARFQERNARLARRAAERAAALAEKKRGARPA